MAKLKDGLPRDVALRLKYVHERSGLTATYVNERLNKKNYLSKVIGAAALKPGAHIPEPGVMVWDALADIYCVSLDYLMGRTNDASFLAEHPEECEGIVAKTANDIARMVTRRLSFGGHEVGPKEFLEWYHECGGVVGHGHVMEDFIQVLEIPDATSRCVRPIMTGRFSLAGQMVGTTSEMWEEVQSWPDDVNAEIVRDYSKIGDLSYGDWFQFRRFTVKLRKEAEPTPYYRLPLRAKLLGSRAPDVAICFAF